MTLAHDAAQRAYFARNSLALRLAVASAAAIAASASAQTSPYESARRGEVGTGLGQQELARGLVFEPRVEGAIQYVDNINQAETSSEQENVAGLELSPGFYASYNSDHFMGAIDYSLITRAWDSGDYDGLSQELAGNGRWTAVPELFYVDADASYADTVIDPSNGLNYGGLGIFNQGNLAEQATASISPTLRKRFNEVEFMASYSYGRVWYLDVGKGQPEEVPTFGISTLNDSEDQSATVSLGTARDGRKLNGRLFYDWQNSEFEEQLPYRFERAGIDGDYRIGRAISLVGEIGKESALDKSTSEGGLDSDFWNAGLRWEPDDRTSAEARYGERFFGTSYTVDIHRRARSLEFTASYSEAPEVETREISLGGFDPGVLPPSIDPGSAGGRFTSIPYVSKDTRVGVTAKGSRTSLTLDVFETKRDYLRAANANEEGIGVTLDADRHLASNLNIGFSASYLDYQRDASLIDAVASPATHDYDTQLVLRGEREFGPRLNTSLEAGYLNRSGATTYDGWWVGLRTRWIPQFR